MAHFFGIGVGVENQAVDVIFGDIFAHSVVDTTAGEDDFGVVAEFFGLVGEVIRIDADESVF